MNIARNNRSFSIMPVVQQIKVPLVAVNDTSVTVIDIPFKQGDAVKKGDIILVFETSKTTYDVIAESDGFIGYQCETDGAYEVNEVVAHIYDDSTEVPVTAIRKNNTIGIPADYRDLFVEVAGTWDGDTLFS